ncbi:hypothetical protein ACFQZR_12345, partial [Paenibacillus sp. GCM10027629]|uniref:hypothetical protein n=1 Tax=Paenibacillus sp. GCM10027629 TaxID=3273414 RepID=UPI00362C46C7
IVGCGSDNPPEKALQTYSSLFPDVSSEHQDSVKKVEDRLNQSWTKGKEVILKSEEAKSFANSTDISEDQDLTKWKFVNLLNLEEELLPSFSRQEQSSFLDVFYNSEEKRENLDVGDYMSALLISPDKSHALVYWEKANGSYVVLEMKTRSDDSNSWYVNGVKIEEL